MKSFDGASSDTVLKFEIVPAIHDTLLKVTNYNQLLIIDIQFVSKFYICNLMVTSAFTPQKSEKNKRTEDNLLATILLYAFMLSYCVVVLIFYIYIN